jgi:tRNA(Ile)-lysidine synthase
MKILAVSGGVDSVVMLDKLARGRAVDSTGAVVAHFNHGIRADSDLDEQLVRRLSGEYGLEFVSCRELLGEGASEELARERRYHFLRKVARERGGKIYTAHHADDIIESIAINLTRGTGWRGLVPLDNPDIERPLLGATKAEILEYAGQHGLEWREDSTNADPRYLRNRLRSKLASLGSSERQSLLRLYAEQKILKREIDTLAEEFVRPDGEYPRELFLGLDDAVALEILRAALAHVGKSATRPQLAEFLAAIRTYQTGKKFNLPGDYLVEFQRGSFRLDNGDNATPTTSSSPHG